MQDTAIRFVTTVEAVQFDGMDMRPVMQLLGYKVKDDQIILSNMPKIDVPLVTYNTSIFGGATLDITPYKMPAMTLEAGMWLVKVGNAFLVMANSEFLKMEIAL